MASCPACKRSLPPSGKCVYCGDAALRDRNFGKRSSSPFMIWMTRVLNVVAVAAFLYGAYWLFLTPPGRAAIDSVMVKLKLKSTRKPESPAQEVLAKFPKVLAMIENRALSIPEEQVDEQNFHVSFTKQDGTHLTRLMTFNVNVVTGVVTPMDDAAAMALRP